MCLVLVCSSTWCYNQDQRSGEMETMATNSNPTRHHDNIGAKGTQIAPVKTRLSVAGIDVPLAKFRNIAGWEPKVTDFIIWHGWWKRWYGVVSLVLDNEVIIIKENMPCLLFALRQEEYQKNTINIPISKIRGSSGGAFHVIQGDTWFIEAQEIQGKRP